MISLEEIVIRGHHLEHLVNAKAKARAYSSLYSKIPPAIREIIEEECQEYENYLHGLGIESHEDKVKVVVGIPDRICKNCSDVEPSCFKQKINSLDVKVAERLGIGIGKPYSFKDIEKYVDREAEKLIPNREKVLYNLIDSLQKLLNRRTSKYHPLQW